jgi:hypothetical protein
MADTVQNCDDLFELEFAEDLLVMAAKKAAA